MKRYGTAQLAATRLDQRALGEKVRRTARSDAGREGVGQPVEPGGEIGSESPQHRIHAEQPSPHPHMGPHPRQRGAPAQLVEELLGRHARAPQGTRQGSAAGAAHRVHLEPHILHRGEETRLGGKGQEARRQHEIHAHGALLSPDAVAIR